VSTLVSGASFSAFFIYDQKRINSVQQTLENQNKKDSGSGVS